MDGYIEITRAAFVALTDGVKCSRVDRYDSNRNSYYHSHGVTLLQIENYMSVASQYYIRDINA